MLSLQQTTAKKHLVWKTTVLRTIRFSVALRTMAITPGTVLRMRDCTVLLDTEQNHRLIQQGTYIIVITLNEEMVITGIATQGYGGPGVLDWVTGFYLLYTSFEGIRLPVINANGREMVK